MLPLEFRREPPGVMKGRDLHKAPTRFVIGRHWTLEDMLRKKPRWHSVKLDLRPCCSGVSACVHGLCFSYPGWNEMATSAELSQETVLAPVLSRSSPTSVFNTSDIQPRSTPRYPQ